MTEPVEDGKGSMLRAVTEMPEQNVDQIACVMVGMFLLLLEAFFLMLVILQKQQR